jgi:plastocyanin
MWNRILPWTAVTRLLPALAVLVLVLALVACGTQENANAGPADSEVTINVKDNVFDPGTVTAPAGKAVKVTFVNQGQNIHEVEIKGLVAETKLQPGQSRSFTITPEQQTYKMYCEIHEDQGMIGQFVGQ